jgi:hypothetical protein
VVEEVVEDSICRADDDVTDLGLASVLVGQVWGVLANAVLLALFQHLTQLYAFLDLAPLL